MTRRKLLTLLFTVLFLPASLVGRDGWPSTFSRTVSRHLILLDSDKWMCSGVVVVRSNTVLTAKHCTDHEGMAVTDYTGLRAPINVFASDSELDLALATYDVFKLAATKIPIKLAEANPDLATAVMAVGFHLNSDPEFVLTRVLGFEGGMMYSVDSWKHGYSGGPLVNLRGELMGINTVIVADREIRFKWYGGTVPIQQVKQFLKRSGL